MNDDFRFMGILIAIVAVGGGIGALSALRPPSDKNIENHEEQTVSLTIVLVNSVEAYVDGVKYDVNNKPSFKVGAKIHIHYKNVNTNKTFDKDYIVDETGNIRDEEMEEALINNNPAATTEDDFPASFYVAKGYDDEIRKLLDEESKISFDDLFK